MIPKYRESAFNSSTLEYWYRNTVIAAAITAEITMRMIPRNSGLRILVVKEKVIAATKVTIKAEAKEN